MTQRRITLYELATGAIKAASVVNEDVLGVYEARGLGWIDGLFPGTEYRIDLGQTPPAPVALEPMGVVVSDYRIDSIPAGAKAILQGQAVDVDDGFLEIEPDLGMPETVRVHLHHMLYLDEVVEVPCP